MNIGKCLVLRVMSEAFSASVVAAMMASAIPIPCDFE